MLSGTSELNCMDSEDVIAGGTDVFAVGRDGLIYQVTGENASEIRVVGPDAKEETLVGDIVSPASNETLAWDSPFRRQRLNVILDAPKLISIGDAQGTTEETTMVIVDQSRVFELNGDSEFVTSPGSLVHPISSIAAGDKKFGNDYWYFYEAKTYQIRRQQYGYVANGDEILSTSEPYAGTGEQSLNFFSDAARRPRLEAKLNGVVDLAVHYATQDLYVAEESMVYRIDYESGEVFEVVSNLEDITSISFHWFNETLFVTTGGRILEVPTALAVTGRVSSVVTVTSTQFQSLPFVQFLPPSSLITLVGGEVKSCNLVMLSAETISPSFPPTRPPILGIETPNNGNGNPATPLLIGISMIFVLTLAGVYALVSRRFLHQLPLQVGSVDTVNPRFGKSSGSAINRSTRMSSIGITQMSSVGTTRCLDSLEESSSDEESGFDDIPTASVFRTRMDLAKELSVRHQPE